MKTSTLLIVLAAAAVALYFIMRPATAATQVTNLGVPVNTGVSNGSTPGYVALGIGGAGSILSSIFGSSNPANPTLPALPSIGLGGPGLPSLQAAADLQTGLANPDLSYI